MKVKKVRCFTSSGISLNLRDTLYHAFDFCNYTVQGENRFQSCLNQIYNAKSKKFLDCFLYKAKFERKEDNALVYSMKDFDNNKEIIKIYIE